MTFCEVLSKNLIRPDIRHNEHFIEGIADTRIVFIEKAFIVKIILLIENYFLISMLCSAQIKNMS